MLASLLPGIRELRAPLAAGFIWLAFFYLVFGKPETLADLPGPLETLGERINFLGATATLAAASFVAYLIGSISQDVFARFLPAGLERLANRFPRRDSTATELDAHLRELDRMAEFFESLAREQARFAEHSVEQAALDPSMERQPDRLEEGERITQRFREGRRTALEDIRRTNVVLREMSAAGASEAEKPEALRPMVEAEENLRTSIVPPLAALSVAVAFSAPVVGLVGLVFSLALYAQAAARHIEARRLAMQHRRSRELAGLEQDLAEAVQGLTSPSAAEDFGQVAWRRIRASARAAMETDTGDGLAR